MSDINDELKEKAGRISSTRKIILGVGIVLIALIFFAIFIFIINIDVGKKSSSETNAETVTSEASESLTYSLTSDKEDYKFGETAIFQVTVTNISSEIKKITNDKACADPILLINETKLEPASGCQAPQSEITIEPGASRSWKWQYKLFKPEEDVSGPDEIALEAGGHTLSSRWINEDQESLEFSLE